MASDLDDKYAQFVSKLIELTQSGSLTWRSRGDDIYVAHLNGRGLQVERVEDESSSGAAPAIGAAFGIVVPRRKNSYVLRLAKTEDAEPFYLRNQYGVQNLYKSAVLTSTKIESFIDSVLGS